MHLNPNQRYWISTILIFFGTTLIGGIVAGSVALRFGEAAAGICGALALIAGYSLWNRVRQRKKLDLPLWRKLTTAQEKELAQYREFLRTGQVSPAPRQHSTRASGKQPLSAKDRARIADVERQRRERKQH